MTSIACVQCGYSTGLGKCLMCQGKLDRSCAHCHIDLPTVWYDLLCLPCAEAEGPEYLSQMKERKERAAHVRACEDCRRPTYSDTGPLCPFCCLEREAQAEEAALSDEERARFWRIFGSNKDK
jgi:hypothetical protein